MIRNFLLAFALLTFVVSCSNGPGPGGKASITGRVHATNAWNSNCGAIANGPEYYAPDVEVYLVYGDDPSYGERVRTNPEGKFWFRYLRPGKYKVYVYSKDCTVPSETVAVEETVEITEKKQEVVLEDLEIKD
jgi:hypothetical protein